MGPCCCHAVQQRASFSLTCTPEQLHLHIYSYTTSAIAPISSCLYRSNLGHLILSCRLPHPVRHQNLCPNVLWTETSRHVA